MLLTIGVIAFSVAQMQAIQEELEILRRQDRSCEAFFAAHPFEPFFVKNLENVQGDERDVIFISPFEDAVCSALEAAGYHVQKQVGSGGFFIDLAIVDPIGPDATCSVLSVTEQPTIVRARRVIVIACASTCSKA